jgi:phosphoglycolate phosphatase
VIRLVMVGVAGTTLAPEATVDRAFDAALAAADMPSRDARTASCRELFDELAGCPVLDVFRRLFAAEDRADAATRAFERSFLTALPGRIEGVRPDAVAALRALRDDGLRTVVTTGWERPLQDALLQSLGWSGEADLEVVLRAVLELRVDNVRHVAVAADSASALLSGWSAGSWIVAGVGARPHQPALSVAPHTHLIGDLSELPALVGSHPDRHPVRRPDPRPAAGVRRALAQDAGSSGISATAPSSRLTVPVSANTT